MWEPTYPVKASPNTMAGQQTVMGAELENCATSMDHAFLVKALRSGDEAAFVSLLDHYYSSMLRLALIYVPNPAVAEEVVQETWMHIVQSLHRFQEHSSLKTWIFSILINVAQKRGQREGRYIPFSSLPGFDAEDSESAVDTEQFLSANHPQWPGSWVSLPRNWENIPEDRLLAQETRMYVRKAIEALPQRQREVIVLCDIEGWTADEVCHLLGVTKTYQRVLLCRARSQVRRVLDQYFNEE